ncbi:MAG: DUF2971 domain-containing protein [bacterium]|nr:DUF2971 domain-containing protein [bacterium]MDI1335404.1 DUF2971 domain-containing protein [Lacunisphaera sp.]
MIERHPTFETPEGTQPLWRYTDLAKYLALLQSSKLHFTRVDKFDDQWEGEISAPTKEWLNNFEKSLGNKSGTRSILFARHWKLTMFVNCWHESDYESLAMWRTYGSGGYNLAVITDVDGLTAAIEGAETPNIYCGRIKYINYQRDRIPAGNNFAAFLRKRKGFEAEREVRLLIWDIPPSLKEGPTEKIVFDVTHKSGGIDVPVKLKSLIKGVRVAPNTPDWLLTTIRGATERYGLSGGLVTRSEMDEVPT